MIENMLRQMIVYISIQHYIAPLRNYVTLPYKECMNLSLYMQITSVALRVIVWETNNGKNTIFKGEVCLHHFPM